MTSSITRSFSLRRKILSDSDLSTQQVKLQVSFEDSAVTELVSSFLSDVVAEAIFVSPQDPYETDPAAWVMSASGQYDKCDPAWQKIANEVALALSLLLDQQAVTVRITTTRGVDCTAVSTEIDKLTDARFFNAHSRFIWAFQNQFEKVV